VGAEVKHAEIIYGVTGQTLVFDAPEGRPSSVTSVTVYEAAQNDDGAIELATSGSASVETSPNTTVSSTSGDGQSDATLVSLTSVASVTRGRRYLLTNTVGETEWVEVKDVAAATTLHTRIPLRNSFLATSTFQSTRMSIAIDATWVADRNNITDWCDGHAGYRVRWVYVVGGATYVHASYFDLVRYPQQNLVTALDVDAEFPGWIDRLPVDYQEDQGAAIICRAIDDVRDDALADEKLLRRVRDTQVLSGLIIRRANLLAIEDEIMRGATGREGALELAKQKFDQRYQQLIREPKVPIDTGEGGASARARRSSLWRR
jgi:hypothetical protein